MFEFIIQITNFVLNLINSFGYIGILIGMTIDSTFIPLPSEIILIPAGALIEQGKMSLIPVLIASFVGTLIGSCFNYFFALILGRDTVDFFISKYGKFLFFKKETLKKGDIYFEKYGDITTFIGRIIPGIRQLISLPAGFSRMDFTRFIIFTALGSMLWAIILISIGFFFGTNASFISSNLDYILILISIIFIAGYILYRRRSRRR